MPSKPRFPWPKWSVTRKWHFQQRCGRPPRWIAAAPGRVNLIGEHTDYNDGFVMPMAIERYVVMAAAASDSPGDGSIQLYSAATGQTQRFCPATSTKEQVAPWARYVLGVMAGCRQRGYVVGDLDVVIESTVPLGGGLSSSAALGSRHGHAVGGGHRPDLGTGREGADLPEGRARLRRHALRDHGPIHVGAGPPGSLDAAGLPLAADRRWCPCRIRRSRC